MRWALSCLLLGVATTFGVNVMAWVEPHPLAEPDSELAFSETFFWGTSGHALATDSFRLSGPLLRFEPSNDGGWRTIPDLVPEAVVTRAGALTMADWHVFEVFANGIPLRNAVGYRELDCGGAQPVLVEQVGLLDTLPNRVMPFRFGMRATLINILAWSAAWAGLSSLLFALAPIWARRYRV